MPIPHLKTIKHRSKKDWYHRPIGVGSGQPWKKNHPRFSLSKIFFKKLLPKLILLGVIGLFFVIGVFAWYSQDLPNPNKLFQREIAESTSIYDRTGKNLLYTIHGAEQRRLVRLDQIPVNLKWATILTEDRTFYEHSGFNLRRLIITAATDVLTGKRAGGSTITQQFVKNAILTPEKKVSRKIKELILSYQIEKKFTKDEILQMYFNEIPYGSTAYGAEVASQIYFGKHVWELNLPESATLAAMPQSPTYYYNHQDQLKNRRDYILGLLAKYKHITPAEAGAAKKTELKFIQKREAITAPHFVMYVKELLTQKYGEYTVEKGGLKVRTTLDIDKQKNAEAAIAEYADRNQSKYQASNAALVALDPKTGDILALVGSRDFYNEEIDGQVNVALMPRQPGSSFKPIVYTAAFKKGYTPNTILFDVVTTFRTETGKNYTPHDYDLGERGPLSIRQALAGSLNIPAVKAIYLTGINNVLDLADSLGYTTLKDRSRFGLSLVLGGGEVKLLEHANAYATFAREGNYLPSRAILKVEDSTGEVLEEAASPIKIKILDKEIVRQTASILSDNNARAYIFGTNNYLTLPGRPVAAKTGTTNNFHDAWTVGFTPSLVAGVWVGNNNNAEMNRGADGSVVAAPIWQKFMKQSLARAPVEGFVAPQPVVTGKPILDGKYGTEVKLKIDKISGKLATASTPPQLIEEKSFNELHSILHYVAKDSPRGPAPTDPAADPYYNSWESAIKDWINRQKEKAAKADPKAFDLSKLNLAPTENDDVHRPENQPIIAITYPAANQEITSAILTANITASAPRGKISRVEYYLDNELFDAVAAPPFSLNRIIIKTPNGARTLEARVYDDVDNTASAQVQIILNLADIIPQFVWLSPQNNTTFKTYDFPAAGKTNIPNPANARTGITVIRYYYNNRLLATDTNPDTSKALIFNWENPHAPGDYELYVEAETYTSARYSSKRVNITIQ